MGQALGRGEELVLGRGNSCGGKTVNQAENKLMRPKFESDIDHWVTLHKSFCFWASISPIPSISLDEWDPILVSLTHSHLSILFLMFSTSRIT